MSATQVLLFLIVGKNEPLFEAEIHQRGAAGNSDAVARQNYFVVHSALDLVEKAAWTTQNVRDRMDYYWNDSCRTRTTNANIFCVIPLCRCI